MIGDYVVYHQENNEDKDWHWTRYDANRDVIGKSTEGYRNKSDCEDNANRQQAEDDEFRQYRDEAGEWRWQVKASNGKIVAAAHRGFFTEGGALNNVKRNGYEKLNRFRKL